MKIKYYINNEKYCSGITLKDDTEPESGNLALHACANEESVLENRRKLAFLLHCGLNRFVCAGQTHSLNFRRVTPADRGCGAEDQQTAISQTDALYTYDPGLVLCCFTADCVPVTFYHETSGLVGVIHSGWQGTVGEITAKVFRYLIENENCDPAGLHVRLGMALSSERFEVEADVAARFQALGYAEDEISFNRRTGKYHIDNQLVVKKQCERQGISPYRITLDRLCTYEEPDGFSYRENKDCGRHLSFILRRQ